MLKWVFGRRDALEENDEARKDVPGYDEAKRIASEGSVKERAKLAALRFLPAEFLYFFATDPSVTVRRAIATNDGTPLQADVILAKDEIDGIRSDLGRKIGRLLPSLTPEQSSRVSQMAYQVIEILAQDQLSDIRAMIAEQIKTLPNVPKDIVLRLAKDVEAVVAAPVLEFSPMLTDQDLIDVIKAGVHGEALSALARRDALSGNVSAAVASTEDDAALPSLLRNNTARIGQETMMAIVNSGGDHPAWHEALAKRGGLNLTLLKRIAAYVSESLVEHLIVTNDFVTSDLAVELRAAVREQSPDPEDDNLDAVDGALRASKLYQERKLTPQVVTLAASRGEREFIVHALSCLTGASTETISAAIYGEGGNRVIVALAWNTRLGMGFAVAVQVNLLGLSEVDVLGIPENSDETQDYPMDETAMVETLEGIGIK